MARGEVQKTLVSLPPELRGVVAEAAVFFEDVPPPEDVSDGMDPGLLGLFDPGPGGMETPRIRLWLGNIWDFSGADPAVFREEVRITLLHEIGHVLGWDEDDLERRGLG